MSTPIHHTLKRQWSTFHRALLSYVCVWLYVCMSGTQFSILSTSRHTDGCLWNCRNHTTQRHRDWRKRLTVTLSLSLNQCHGTEFICCRHTHTHASFPLQNTVDGYGTIMSRVSLPSDATRSTRSNGTMGRLAKIQNTPRGSLWIHENLQSTYITEWN